MTEATTGITLAEGEVFATFDRLDDNQILAEMRGELIEEYVYRFTQDGHEVTGLTWKGTKEAARQMGGVQVDLLQGPLYTEETVAFIVKATDVKTASSRLGMKVQPLAEKLLRDNTTRPDRFASEKALSKAQRNAIRALLPEDLMARLIEEYLGQRRVRDVTPHDVRQELPPARPSLPTQGPRCPKCNGEVRESRYRAGEMYCVRRKECGWQGSLDQPQPQPAPRQTPGQPTRRRTDNIIDWREPRPATVGEVLAGNEALVLAMRWMRGKYPDKQFTEDELIRDAGQYLNLSAVSQFGKEYKDLQEHEVGAMVRRMKEAAA